MSYFDDYDDDIIFGDWRHKDEEPAYGHRSLNIQCRKCGRRGLMWSPDQAGQWHLTELSLQGGRLHVCLLVAPEDDFDPV